MLDGLSLSHMHVFIVLGSLSNCHISFRRQRCYTIDDLPYINFTLVVCVGPGVIAALDVCELHLKLNYDWVDARLDAEQR